MCQSCAQLGVDGAAATTTSTVYDDGERDGADRDSEGGGDDYVR